MYPKWAGVPRMTPPAQSTSSAVASRAWASRTSTSPASGSRQPARTASTISWVWPELECHTTRSWASAMRQTLPQLSLEDLPGGVGGQLVHEHEATGFLEPPEHVSGVGDEVGEGHLAPRDDDRAHRFAPALVRHAHHGHLADGGMGGQDVLDLPGGHVLAPADDDVLRAVHDVQVPVVVDLAQVAGVQPSGDDRRRRRLRVVPV